MTKQRKPWEKGGPSPNPKGRPTRRNDSPYPAIEVMDDIRSAVLGMGSIGTDKRLSAHHHLHLVPYDEASIIWRSSDLAARIIETVPNEALRQGYYFKCEDKELAELVQTRWVELGLDNFLWRLWTFERAYGGGGGLIGANDGQEDLTQPLNPDRVVNFQFLTSLEPTEVVPRTWYNDPRNPKFGMPEIYRITPISQGGTLADSGLFSTEVHESRFIIFQGVRVSRRAQTTIQGWGDSILTRILPVLRDFDVTWGSAAVLMTDFAQAVFKMKDLPQLLAGDTNEIFKGRMQALDYGRSTIRAMVIDSEEDFERKATPLTGMPEMLDRFATRLAAAADMPLTLLMGQSPAGLNATGASDIRFFYDRVKALQTTKLKPAIEYVTKLILNSLGKNVEPDTWTIEFHPLWQPTAQEIAQSRYTQAQTDQIYLNGGVVSPEEIAVSRFGGDDYSFETIVDFEARANLEPAADAPVKPESEEEPVTQSEPIVHPENDPNLPPVEPGELP